MEQWRPVVGWENLFSVSSKGRIKSLQRKTIHKNGFVQTINEKILNGTISFYGYRIVDLTKQGRRRNAKVHKLVLEAFVGPCPIGYEVCHIDGDKLNNNLENLKYGTRQDNVNDTKRHGNIPIGENHWNAKIPDNEINKIKKSTLTKTKLSKKYNVSFACIHDIKTGRRRNKGDR